MIEGIEIFNFQSHKYSKIEFSPGVNFILGKTDEGKTAFLRAFDWVKENRPLGNDYCSWWAKETKVIIYVDGKAITRIKSDTVNMYKIDKEEFEAFGTSVPPEVTRLLNLNEINLQKQLDAPFLLSNTAGEVAAHFNKIANLDIIGTTTKNIQKWTSQIKNSIASKKEDLKTKRQELKQYDNLDKFEADIEVLETMQQQKQSLKSSRKKLNTIIIDIEVYEEKILALQNNLAIESTVDKVLEAFEKRKTLNKERTDLTKLIDKIEANEQELEEAKKLIQAESIVNETLELIKTRARKVANLTELRGMWVSVLQKEKEVKNIRENLKQLETEYHDKFPDVCPLCGTKVKKK